MVPVNRRSCKSFWKRRKKNLLKVMWCGCDKHIMKLVYVYLFILTALMVLVWQIIRDKCHTEILVEHLCSDYKEGQIAGPWCADLCDEKLIQLPRCQDQSTAALTFHYQGSIIKLPLFSMNSHSNKLPEPLSMELLDQMLQQLFQSRLGKIDVSDLMNKVYMFADFNHDGTINYGEANSVWMLLNVHEFFLLFAFNGDPVFPVMNGTCGALYSYQHIKAIPLYNKQQKGILDSFFSNTYRWNFPEWQKRVNVVVSLLEYSITFSELYNARFFICDDMETCFGQTSRFDVKMLSFDSILPEYMIGNILQNYSCKTDSDCHYKSQCYSSCDLVSGRCTNILQNPSQISICRVIEDYLLFDAPDRLKFQLETLVRKCNRIGYKIDRSFNETEMNLFYVRFNTVIADIQMLLWNEVKNKPNNWLNPPKVHHHHH